MKRFLAVIVALLVVPYLHAQQLSTTKIRDIHSGKTIPFNQSIEKGKVTLICFWGTWCAHGKHQVKTIAQNLPAWHKQLDFSFIATDEQTTEHLLFPYVRKQGWTFPATSTPTPN